MKAIFICLMLCACGGQAKPIGASCSQNQDCASDLCAKGTIDCGGQQSTCRCQKDSDCASGQQCKLSVDCGVTCQ